jgi:hypothetical protein
MGDAVVSRVRRSFFLLEGVDEAAAATVEEAGTEKPMTDDVGSELGRLPEPSDGGVVDRKTDAHDFLTTC